MTEDAAGWVPVMIRCTSQRIVSLIDALEYFVMHAVDLPRQQFETMPY